MGRVWVGLGGVVGAGAVGMAAAVAHILAGAPPGVLHAVESGVQMQGWHALALLGCGVWVQRAAGWARRLGNLAGAAFALGVVLFCGAVYASGLGGMSLGPVAPTGGLLLIAGWLLLAAAAFARG